MTKTNLYVLVIILLFCGSRSIAQDSNTSYISWNPDGTSIAVARGKQVEILDTETGDTLNTFTTLTGPEFSEWEVQRTAPVWNSDGSLIAISNGGSIQIWQEPESTLARLVRTVDVSDGIFSMAWNPNINQLVVGPTPLKLIDVSTGELIYQLPDHAGIAGEVAWSPDGSLIASASSDAAVRIFQAAEGELLSTMTLVAYYNLNVGDRYTSSISLDWAPTGAKLAFGTENGTLRVWDFSGDNQEYTATTNSSEGVFQAHDKGVISVDWNPIYPLIATTGKDNLVRIWDVETEELLGETHLDTLSTAAWSADGSKLAYISDISKGIEFIEVSELGH